MSPTALLKTCGSTYIAGINFKLSWSSGRRMSPDIAVPGEIEPCPRKYDKEGQVGMGSKNYQEINRGIL